jgi:Ca2+-binding EF-hand superfamily protein
MTSTRTPRHLAAWIGIGIGISSACFTLPALAQIGIGGLKELDANGDQSISADEVTAMSQKQFARMDTNHDGQISQTEFTNANLAVFKTLDANSDGTVDRAEVRERMREARNR